MSYILDALRKSEQLRQRDAAPLLFTMQISSDVEKQPAFLLYGLVAVILICAGILIGWLHPWQQDKIETVKNPIATSQHEAKLPQIVQIRQPLPPEPEKDKKPELKVETQKSISTIKLASETGITKQSVPAPTKTQSSRYQAIPALPKVSEPSVEEAVMPAIKKVIPPTLEPSTNDPAEIVREQKIIAMTELPLSIQQEIPMMTISGYAYSNVPKERSVGINDRLLQEGEYLAPGLRLEQISSDGLIFSYKKYFFRHSL